MANQNQTKKKSNQILTPTFRASFVTVYEPRAAVEGQKLKYSVQMLFKKTDNIDVIKAAIRQAAVDKFGVDKTKWPKVLRNPIRDGAEKEYEGYGPDVFFIGANSTTKPGLIDQKKDDIIDRTEFQSGDYARATIRAYGYSVSGNNGITFELLNIQKVRDGEHFSGKNKAEKDFDAIPMPDAKEGAGDVLGDGGAGAPATAAVNDPLGLG